MVKNKIKFVILLLIVTLILSFPVTISDSIFNLYGEDEVILTLYSFNVSIDTPNGFLYVFNIPIVPLPPMMPFMGIIIGPITVSASVDADVVDNVEFYVDNQLKHNTSSTPYEWTWNEGLRPPPIHQLKVMAYSGDDIGIDEILVLYVNPF